MRAFYRSVVAGKRVLVADDVRNTGKTFERAKAIVEESGGTVIATCEIYDRLEAIVDLGVPNFALAEYKAPENFAAADCPMCQAGEPITSFEAADCAAYGPRNTRSTRNEIRSRSPAGAALRSV